MSWSEGDPAPAPLLRVYLFGECLLERLVSQANEQPPRYEPVGNDAWKGRGPALALFKVLLCYHHRRAMKDTLVEALWPEPDEEERDRRLKSAERAFDAAASVLRSVLRTADGKSLLCNYAVNDGWVYKLSEQSILWVDVDTFSLLVEQATRATDAQQALPLWEAAYRMTERGEILEDDRYSDWARGQRESIGGKVAECVYALADLYTAQQRVELARDVLWDFIKAHPTDEDALCRLLLLLEQQGRVKAAWQLYQEVRAKAEQEGVSLTPRIHKLAKRIRERLLTVEPLPVAVSARDTTGETVNGLLLPLAALPSAQYPDDVIDSALWFGERLALILTLLNLWRGQGQHCADLQRLLHREITMSMTPDLTNETYQLSRRQALVALAVLPSSLVALLRTGQGTLLPAEDFLPQCAASVTACWHLLQGNDIAVVEEALRSYMPTLISLAQQPSPHQQTSAYLAAQSYLLKGLLALHQMKFATRASYCQEAITYSHIAQDQNLQVAALMHLGCTLYYHQEATQALQTFQEAVPLVNEVSPLLRSCVNMRLAMASARCNQQQEALRHIGLARETFPESPEDDPGVLYAEYGISNLYLVEGQAYLDLSAFYPGGTYVQQAQDTFALMSKRAPAISVPERNRVQLINNQARTAVVLNDQEQFREYLIQGIHGAARLGSQKRRQEAIDAYKLARKSWSDDTRVKELAELFLS